MGVWYQRMGRLSFFITNRAGIATVVPLWIWAHLFGASSYTGTGIRFERSCPKPLGLARLPHELAGGQRAVVRCQLVPALEDVGLELKEPVRRERGQGVRRGRKCVGGGGIRSVVGEAGEEV